MPTIKDLKTVLEQNQATWSVNESLLDADEIPRYTLGGSTEGLELAEQVSAIDFKDLFAVQPNNPFILERRIVHGIVPKSLVQKRYGRGSSPELKRGEGAVPMEEAAPASLDWRNRWGWSWITSIRNQNGCGACWLFAAVALVEAMVRIEHCVWPWISEGDVHKGMGARCCDGGNVQNALNWIKGHGAADPGCFAWPVTAADCSVSGGGAPYDNVPYTPSFDRAGRSVRIPSYTEIGSIADQKKWLDTVGPIAINGFEVYTDFFSYGTGVYHKQAVLGTPPHMTPNKLEGTHCMLVVGYDDSQSCWIVKNSWGAGWGQGGFCRIGYGECKIDSYAKVGLTGTNPDPWTKRRLHSGCMIESGNGALHRNFEMLIKDPAGGIRHWWRDNSGSGSPWLHGMVLGNDAQICPTFTSTTFNRNFESIHVTTTGRLHHWYFDQTAQIWKDGGVFGPADARGYPGFIQSNYGPGNFEVVVRTADSKLNFWWRDGNGWHDGGRFAQDVEYSGPTLVQSHYGTRGNFELVCVLKTGQMQRWWRDNDHGSVWKPGEKFGSSITSVPYMIEGQYGASNERAVGNFELCVAVDGKIQHWWRANSSDALWRKSATFGHDVATVVGFVEGSYGFNLELVVIRRDHRLQHYWRDGNGWHEGVIIGNP